MIGRLNLIELSLDTFRFGDSPRREPIVVVRVDGDDLFGLLEAARGSTDADEFEDDDDLGPVPGVSPSLVAPPARHWLGEPQSDHTRDGRALIFNCECGHWPCGGLLALINVSDQRVRWSDIVEVAGEALPVGPFEFDRGQYEHELQGLALG